MVLCGLVCQMDFGFRISDSISKMAVIVSGNSGDASSIFSHFHALYAFSAFHSLFLLFSLHFFFFANRFKCFMANGQKIYCRQFADVPQRVSVWGEGACLGTLGYRRIRNGNHSGNTQISSDFSPWLWLALKKRDRASPWIMYATETETSKQRKNKK